MNEDNIISIKVEGLDKVLKALEKFPHKIASYMSQAGVEAGKDLIEQEGLKKYPPRGPWNQPPVPYYKRGTGMVYKNKIVRSSQVYGKQWYVERKSYGAEIGNRASYAKYLAGEEGERVYWATSHGWLPLFTTAKRHIKEITATFQKWTDKLIKDLGL
jgi:hypothetical protein